MRKGEARVLDFRRDERRTLGFCIIERPLYGDVADDAVAGRLFSTLTFRLLPSAYNPGES